MGKIIFGAILIVLQILSYLGSAYAGQLNFFTSCSAFEVVYFLSYNLVGIVGFGFGCFRRYRKNQKQK